MGEEGIEEEEWREGEREGQSNTNKFVGWSTPRSSEGIAWSEKCTVLEGEELEDAVQDTDGHSQSEEVGAGLHQCLLEGRRQCGRY